MKVLVLFEYSGVVRDAFIRQGHTAISLDTLPSESNVGDHIQVDINLYPPDYSVFDIIIAHPPCTKLCVSGNGTYGKGKIKEQERLQSIEWTTNLWNEITSVCDRVCFENPVGVLSTQSSMGKPTQYIQPWMFGHTEKKKTGLWLKGLSPLIPTNNVYEEMCLLPIKEQQKIWYMGNTKERGKLRSRFYTGIAEAMATQWVNL